MLVRRADFVDLLLQVADLRVRQLQLALQHVDRRLARALHELQVAVLHLQVPDVLPQRFDLALVAGDLVAVRGRRHVQVLLHLVSLVRQAVDRLLQARPVLLQPMHRRPHRVARRPASALLPRRVRLARLPQRTQLRLPVPELRPQPLDLGVARLSLQHLQIFLLEEVPIRLQSNDLS